MAVDTGITGKELMLEKRSEHVEDKFGYITYNWEDEVAKYGAICLNSHTGNDLVKNQLATVYQGCGQRGIGLA